MQAFTLWSKRGQKWVHDEVVERLLAVPKMKDMLRRYRNGVMHFQRSLTDARFADLLREGERHVFWVNALHHEFVRFLFNYFSNMVMTTEQRTELRTLIEGTLGWYPYNSNRLDDSMERLISRARGMLSQPWSDASEKSQLELAITAAEQKLSQSRLEFRELRKLILNKATN